MVSQPYHKLSRTEPTLLVTEKSIKGWLPGKTDLEISVPLPGNIVPGKYKLALGVVDVKTEKPSISLAITGGQPDGWYPMGTIHISK